MPTKRFEAAEVVLPAPELEQTVTFFCERLGFRVLAVSPADDPQVVVVAGHGLRLRLERDRPGDPGVVRLLCRDPAAVAEGASELTAPNGTRIELAAADPPLILPPLRPELVLSRLADARWGTGRAGMHYRDLLPSRLGGRFVASHIRIPEGGPVPDYVHFHKVRFQLIYCRRGWVRVVYEDQGPPFVLEAGDCVLQPPRIRHRVLESSPGLEVIELGSPAVHETLVDLNLELPTPVIAPEREFDGQRFVRHELASATWQPWRLGGFECRDSGIAAATGGLASVRVARLTAGAAAPTQNGAACHCHDAELVFCFVLEGGLTLQLEGRDPESLGAGDAFVVPAGESHALSACAADLQLLEVTFPATFATTAAVASPDGEGIVSGP